MTTVNPENIFLIMEMRRMGIAEIKVMEAVEKISFQRFNDEGFINEMAQENSEAVKISRFLAVAMICEALKIEKQHKVLEIGTGSGYQTAILAKLCRRVYSIDLDKDLLHNSEKTILGLGLNNFTLMKADPEKGLENQAPFDRIVSNKVFYEVPEAIKKQLKDGGLMIAPLGFAEGDNQELKVFTLKSGIWETKEIMPIKFIYP